MVSAGIRSVRLQKKFLSDPVSIQGINQTVLRRIEFNRHNKKKTPNYRHFGDLINTLVFPYFYRVKLIGYCNISGFTDFESPYYREHATGSFPNSGSAASNEFTSE